MIERIKHRTIIENIIEGVGLLIILSGIITSIKMNLEGHSLWWDEAALAYSFSQRGLVNLTSSGLEKLQSAPVGWLYMLKICTMIGGNTDFVLRIPSILAYIGTLLLTYIILRKTFHIHYPVTGTAFVASLPIILQYSNIFKPYITDCLFTLLVICFFDIYDKKRIGSLVLGILLAILIWFSNPSCFVAGGMIAALFFKTVFEKNKCGIVDIIKICVPLAVSFVVYYLYWLRQTATDDTMLFYWKDWNLPLFIKDKTDIYQIAKCAGTIFAEFYRLEYIVIISLIACLIYAWHKKNWMYWGVYFGFAVCLFASALGKFPVNKRLWLYIYPLIVIVVSVGIDALINNERNTKYSVNMVGVLLLGCSLLNGGVRYYWQTDNTYWPRYEVKKDYEYIMEHIAQDEAVYVCVNQTPIFDYYNEYVSENLNGRENPVMEGDNEYLAPYDYQKDIAFITENKKCYVMMGDGWTIDYFMEDLFKGLYQAGYFEMVYNPYETPLWYYCTDIQDINTVLSYEITEEQGQKFLQIRNEGTTYVSTQYEKLVLQICDSDGNIKYAYNITDDIEPNTSVNLSLDEISQGEYIVKLSNEYKEIIPSQRIIVE